MKHRFYAYLSLELLDSPDLDAFGDIFKCRSQFYHLSMVWSDNPNIIIGYSKQFVS